MTAATNETHPKPGSPIALLGFLCILALGAILRLYDLDRRLMHGDEANQAIKTALLLETGEYAYDPHEHHGPTLYYFSNALERILGHNTRANMTETSLRIIPAFFGIATIALVWLLRTAVGTPATLFAALLLALSPALTFYSRYYIQETLLACFTLAAVIATWRYIIERKLIWSTIAAAALALMFTTKETWVISVAGLIVATIVAFRWSVPTRTDKPNYIVHTVVALMVAGSIWLTLFSSFFTTGQGLIDSFSAYAAYFDRGNQPTHHQHPWHFYLARLAWHHPGPGPHWTEAFILLSAALGTVASIAKRNRFGLYITAFTLVVILILSLIRYKTPWNLIQFHVPLCILGGLGLGFIWNALQSHAGRAALTLVALIAAAHLAWLNHAANFTYPEYPYNPYVYGHTSSAFQRLVDRIDTVAADHPDRDNLLIAVIQPDGDYWPIPWYLRTYDRVGYWTTIPNPLPSADIFILDSTTATPLHDQLTPNYTFETHALRPRILRTVYIKKAIND